MTSIEKSLLENLKKSLVESTETDWTYGDLDEWSNLAKKK